MKQYESTKEFLNAQATPSESWARFAEDNQRNEQTNRRGFQAAVRVLLYLRENNYSKAWLAEQMGVSPQYVGKMLKGGSNVTLATIEKLETATGLVLLAVPEARSVRYRAAAVSGSVTDFFTKTFLPAEQPAYFSLA